MSFEKLLTEASTNLFERSSKMTPPQRKKVSELGKLGWSIKSKDDGEILMYKDSSESIVRDDGKVEIIKEGVRFDVTDIITALDVGA